ncbi:hypothetical protein N9X98_05830 [Candidatus Poseidoniales archaeon]|nr:hypothetical protein [Candidatus Poseidoniales archaeon]
MPKHTWWRNVSVYEPPFLKRSPIVGIAMYASMILAVVMVRTASITTPARVEVTYED